MGIIQYLGKCFFILILSIIQSFNYLNHIPLLLLYLYHIKDLDFEIYSYLSISLVIYDITKYFFKLFSIRMMKLIGVHEYLLFSLGLLIIIQLGYSFIFYYYKLLTIFISYRLFLSLFNNLSSFINFPLSRLYDNKKINNRIENFTFSQKLFNFLIFLISFFILKDLNSIHVFCFLLSLLNFIGFILYLIIFVCKDQNEKQYYPQVSEKIQNKKTKNENFIKEKNNKASYIFTNKKEINKLRSTKNNVNSENYGDNTNLEIISGENKNKFFLNHKNRNFKININENPQEGSINFYKNISEIEINKNIKSNFNDSSLKNRLYQKNNSNINNSEIINKIESSSDVVLGQFYGENSNNKNKSKFDANQSNFYPKPTSFHNSNNQQIHLHKNQSKDKNFNNNLSSENSKNINKMNKKNISYICLILIHGILKFFNFFSIFLLLIKFYEVKAFLNNNKIYFINSALEEIMILFSFYYLIHIILFLINKIITSFIIKGGFLVKFFIIILHLLYILSITIFLFLFFDKNCFDRKNIILTFSLQLILSENSMILLIYYNKLVVNKGLNQHNLRETKSLGILIGSILFIIFSIVRGMFLYVIKMKLNFFDNFFLFSIFLIFYGILFITILVL